MDAVTKYQLRKEYREKRMKISAKEYLALNDRLISQVKQWEMRQYSMIHIFLPIQGNNEPDTYAITDWIRQEYPHIQLVLPRVKEGTFEMSHFIWEKGTSLLTNRWGIPEPQIGAVAVSPREIDVVFVPLLAFDEYGNRVGYGKGFYDRFLAECSSSVVKTGLSLFEAVAKISDTDRYDIALDQCITPTRIWEFNTAP